MFDRYVVTPIIALGLAFLIWVYLRSRDQEVQVYAIPVEVTLDSGQSDRFIFESKPEAKIRVKFYGLPKGLRAVKDMVEGGALMLRKVARVPLEVDQRQENEYQEALQVEASSLMSQLPEGVHAEINAADGRVPISLVRITEKSLPLQHSVLSAGGQFELDGAPRIEPATVKVTGPKRVLDQVSQLVLDPWQPTPPAGFDVTAESSVEVASLQRVPTKIGREGVRVKVSPELVDLRIKIKPALRVYELTDVPISFLCPANFPYQPQFGTERLGTLPKLRLRGPANKSPEPRDIRAYVDLTTKQNLKHGLYPDEPIQFDLPNGFLLAQDPPRLSAIKLVQIESGPAKPSEGTNQ